MASVNIFGGFLVTQRMLAMYKKKEKRSEWLLAKVAAGTAPITRDR